MKSKNLLLLIVIALFMSCTEEGAEAFLEATERPCYDEYNEAINTGHEETNYQASLYQRPDGSWETIEDCMAILEIYNFYLEALENERDYFLQLRSDGVLECSEYDLNSIENLFTGRIHGAQDTVDFYSFSCG